MADTDDNSQENLTRWERVGAWLRRNGEVIVLTLTAISAIGSAVGAWAAWRAADISAAQVIYGTKSQAIGSYARAAETYASAVRVATFDMSDEIFNPDYVGALSDMQLMNNAQVARRVIEARTLYLAETDAQAAIWSDDTVLLVAGARTLSLNLSACFLNLGALANRPTPTVLKMARDVAVKDCAGASQAERLDQMEQANLKVFQAMAQELEKSAGH